MVYKLQQIILELSLGYSNLGAETENLREKLDGFLRIDSLRRKKCYTCNNIGAFHWWLGM